MRNKSAKLTPLALPLTLLFLLSAAPHALAQGGVPPAAPQPEKRFALVVGNGSYPEAPLSNPVNDARDIAAALRECGFEVTQRENLTRNEMKKEIRAFGRKIRGGGVSLFYFAGHGIQVNGSNYLIPVGADISTEEQVEYEAVELGTVMAEMKAARAQTNIIILDACRNNPYERAFRSYIYGLALTNAPTGTLIAYATAPGKVAADGTGRNGVFTQELLSNIRTPGLTIENLFKRVRVAVQARTNGRQVPWENSSLVRDFYFVAPAVAPAAARCEGDTVFIGQGPRRLELRLPRGWTEIPVDDELREGMAMAQDAFGASIPAEYMRFLFVSQCSEDGDVLAVTTISFPPDESPSSQEVMRFLSRDSTEVLNEVYARLSEQYKRLGMRLRVTARPTPLGRDEMEGARITFEATKDDETIRVVYVLCRNIIDEKTILIISGASEPEGVAEMDSIIKSIIRR